MTNVVDDEVLTLSHWTDISSHDSALFYSLVYWGASAIADKAVRVWIGGTRSRALPANSPLNSLHGFIRSSLFIFQDEILLFYVKRAREAPPIPK